MIEVFIDVWLGVCVLTATWVTWDVTGGARHQRMAVMAFDAGRGRRLVRLRCGVPRSWEQHTAGLAYELAITVAGSRLGGKLLLAFVCWPI